jgi:hypothetical protein
MGLVRQLMMTLAKEGTPRESEEIDLPYDQAIIDEHLRIMAQAGLITLTTMRAGVVVQSIEWAGYDFLDSARDDVIWKRVMRNIASTSKTVGFEVLMAKLKQATLDDG